MTAPASNQWRMALVLQRAQLQATVDRLDVGSANACVRLYKSARPAALGQPDTPMAVVTLARPCGIVSEDGLLVLQPADLVGTMVLESGQPRWAELVAGDGTVLLDGGVTDAAHDGCFQVSGAATPEGDDSPMFYAGALLTLAPTALT